MTVIIDKCLFSGIKQNDNVIHVIPLMLHCLSEMLSLLYFLSGATYVTGNRNKRFPLQTVAKKLETFFLMEKRRMAYILDLLFIIFSQVAQLVSSKAVDWMGGAGFVKSNPIEKFYRDSKIGINP